MSLDRVLGLVDDSRGSFAGVKPKASAQPAQKPHPAQASSTNQSAAPINPPPSPTLVRVAGATGASPVQVLSDKRQIETLQKELNAYIWYATLLDGIAFYKRLESVNRYNTTSFVDQDRKVVLNAFEIADGRNLFTYFSGIEQAVRDLGFHVPAMNDDELGILNQEMPKLRLPDGTPIYDEKDRLIYTAYCLLRRVATGQNVLFDRGDHEPDQQFSKKAEMQFIRLLGKMQTASKKYGWDVDFNLNPKQIAERIQSKLDEALTVAVDPVIKKRSVMMLRLINYAVQLQEKFSTTTDETAQTTELFGLVNKFNSYLPEESKFTLTPGTTYEAMVIEAATGMRDRLADLENHLNDPVNGETARNGNTNEVIASTRSAVQIAIFNLEAFMSSRPTKSPAFLAAADKAPEPSATEADDDVDADDTAGADDAADTKKLPWVLTSDLTLSGIFGGSKTTDGNVSSLPIRSIDNANKWVAGRGTVNENFRMSFSEDSFLHLDAFAMGDFTLDEGGLMRGGLGLIFGGLNKANFMEASVFYLDREAKYHSYTNPEISNAIGGAFDFNLDFAHHGYWSGGFNFTALHAGWGDSGILLGGYDCDNKYAYQQYSFNFHINTPSYNLVHLEVDSKYDYSRIVGIPEGDTTPDQGGPDQIHFTRHLINAGVNAVFLSDDTANKAVLRLGGTIGRFPTGNSLVFAPDLAMKGSLENGKYEFGLGMTTDQRYQFSQQGFVADSYAFWNHRLLKTNNPAGLVQDVEFGYTIRGDQRNIVLDGDGRRPPTNYQILFGLYLNTDIGNTPL